MAAEESSGGMGSADWEGAGPQGCGLALAQEAGKRESVWGPSQAGQVE